MKNFVGFGFGPIQSALMVYEAQRSGNFASYTIAEVDQELVDAVRANNDCVHINIAHADRIETAALTNLRLLNPMSYADTGVLAAAVQNADELATALPSVDFYDKGIAKLLADNINDSKPRVLYACENNNYAAEHLETAIKVHGAMPENFRIINTVIGKMSGVIADSATIDELGLARLTPDSPRAVLVEAFNAIQISRIDLDGFAGGIPAFREKADLMPFEEAKLFGHNAIHAMLGYLAAERGYTAMSEIASDSELIAIGRAAFVDECGAALAGKYAGVDPLFTPAGFQAYAEDLLTRMTNQFLQDAVARICRDPQRKLAYGDRLVGAMRLAIDHGIEPRNLARGVVAALRYWQPESTLDAATAGSILRELWDVEKVDTAAEQVIALVGECLLVNE
jgi:mannitol-1-phosphate 5-dehydrogenase